MGSLALIYLLLGAEFVAVVQVIIYAGAIMVLFIFVIMLLNAGEEERPKAATSPCSSAFPDSSLGGIIGIWVLLQHRSAQETTDPHRRALRPRRSSRHDAVHQISSGL